MDGQFSRRLFLLHLLLLAVSGCQSTSSFEGQLTIGVINYGGGEEIIDRFAHFKSYLGERTKANIQLEPTFNENKAIERIQASAWSLVFAPPGLVAIAARYQYIPLFPLLDLNNLRSVLVVRQDSPLHDLKQLQAKTVALGQPGSATGYYFPLYNLYGLTLAEILFAPTPKTVLEWVAEGKAIAGAVSMADFNLYSSQLSQTQLRILYTDPHYVPSGSVLIGPSIERNRQNYIRKVLSEFPSMLASDVGYVPNGQLPDYRYMMFVVEHVRAIAAHTQEKPTQLF
ncbi:MAG: PhnD/SsuA/transferrin family substrate-binding protein [Rhizonema sp. NSF051]|nr:PhnD/SsuA/transferrin family substrate-binding protein [Rhizonema sp. NSF051]